MWGRLGGIAPQLLGCVGDHPHGVGACVYNTWLKCSLAMSTRTGEETIPRQDILDRHCLIMLPQKRENAINPIAKYMYTVANM